MARRRQSNRTTQSGVSRPARGNPSVFTCPDCQGTLFILNDGNLIRFRCRIGHLYSPEAMLEAQEENVERLMWSAVRALEEKAEYNSQMADQIAGARDSNSAKHYMAKSRSAMRKATALRELITTDSEHRERNAVADPVQN